MSKYHAKPVVIDGIRFDSTTEGNYYRKYKEMEEKGEIQNLRLQVSYELLPKFTEEIEEIKHLKTRDKIVKKTRVVQRAIHYVADFVYEQDGKTRVIDVKGYRTKEYRLKKAMMYAKYGIMIEEVGYQRPKRKRSKGNLSLVCLHHLLSVGRTSHRLR